MVSMKLISCARSWNSVSNVCGLILMHMCVYVYACGCYRVWSVSNVKCSAATFANIRGASNFQSVPTRFSIVGHRRANRNLVSDGGRITTRWKPATGGRSRTPGVCEYETSVGRIQESTCATLTISEETRTVIRQDCLWEVCKSTAVSPAWILTW